MAVKYVFVTGGVVSGLGKGDYSCISRTSAESSWLHSYNAEIRSIHQH